MNQNIKGICFTVVGGCCWGMSGVMGKYLFDAKDLTATWLVTVRLLGAGITMLLFLYQFKGKSIFFVWKRKDSAISQMIFGIIGMAMCQMTFFLAIQESNPGTATVIQYSAPILIMVLFAFVEKRFPKKEEVFVLIIVVIGIFLLATHGSIKNLVITNAALFWGLLSAGAFAVYNVQPRKLIQEFGTLETVGWGMLIGGILVTPFTKVWNVPGHWDIVTVSMTIGVVFLGTIVSFSCYLYGISMLGPVQGSMLGCVEPLVATILSATVLGQAFGMIDVVGILCIVGAVTALTVVDA